LEQNLEQKNKDRQSELTDLSTAREGRSEVGSPLSEMDVERKSVRSPLSEIDGWRRPVELP